MATTTAPPQSTYVERERQPRRSRLNAVAAWVGIVAGTVFIVAVIFFSGFILGAHAGGGHHGHHGHHRHRYPAGSQRRLTGPRSTATPSARPTPPGRAD